MLRSRFPILGRRLVSGKLWQSLRTHSIFATAITDNANENGGLRVVTKNPSNNFSILLTSNIHHFFL